MIQISTDDAIILDGVATGLKVTQRRDGTVVYTPEFEARRYREHAMPHARYSLTHPHPASGAAGCDEFERDIRALLASL